MSTLLASPRLAFLKKDSYMTRLAIVFLLLLIFFAAVRPGPFFAVRTWQSMAVQFPEFGLMSLGVMFTMFTAGIDLSVVAIANVTGICAALTLRATLTGPATASSIHDVGRPGHNRNAPHSRFTRNDTRSAPTQRHQETHHHRAQAHRNIPLTDLRNRVHTLGNVEHDNPQQTHNHECHERRSPPDRAERNTIRPILDLGIVLDLVPILLALFRFGHVGSFLLARAGRQTARR